MWIESLMWLWPSAWVAACELAMLAVDVCEWAIPLGSACVWADGSDEA